MILQAMRNALDRAASADFDAAFNQSTDQDDYLWGYLHRITFRHPLGAAYSFPTGAGFNDVQPDLAGVSTDGGFGVVDASSHSPRANSVNAFTFGSGPARRFVAEARDDNPKAVEVIPGGASGGPWGPWFGNQLGSLADQRLPRRHRLGEGDRRLLRRRARAHAVSGHRWCGAGPGPPRGSVDA